MFQLFAIVCRCLLLSPLISFRAVAVGVLGFCTRLSRIALHPLLWPRHRAQLFERRLSLDRLGCGFALGGVSLDAVGTHPSTGVRGVTCTVTGHAVGHCCGFFAASRSFERSPDKMFVIA